MKKNAIYARYSNDNQNPKSVDDQLAIYKEWLGQHFAGNINSDTLNHAWMTQELIPNSLLIALL